MDFQRETEEPTPTPLYWIYVLIGTIAIAALLGLLYAAAGVGPG